MKNKFLISESERQRILNLHLTATKKQYLSEQVSEDDLKEKFITRMNWIYSDNGTALNRFIQGQILAEGKGYLELAPDKSSYQVVITQLTTDNFQPGLVMTENDWNTWENTIARGFPKILEVKKDENGNTILKLDKPFDADGFGDINNQIKYIQGYPPFKSTRLDDEREYYKSEDQLLELLANAPTMTTSEFVQSLSEIDSTYLDRVEPSNQVYNSYKDYIDRKPCKPTYELYKITNLLNIVISKLIFEFEFQKSLYNRDQDVTLTQFNCND